MGRHHSKYDPIVFDLSGITVYDNNDVTNVLRRTLKIRADLEVTLEQANAMLGSAKDVSLADILTLSRITGRGDRS